MRDPNGVLLCRAYGVVEIMMFALRQIAWLLTALFSAIGSAVASADAGKSEYRVWQSPTMAAFYSVEDDGRSVREAVDVAVIADPDSSASRVLVTGRPKSKKKAAPKKVQSVKLKNSVKRPRRDSFAEFRCERYGFYYTRRGDCVVPVNLHRVSPRESGRASASGHLSKTLIPQR